MMPPLPLRSWETPFRAGDAAALATARPALVTGAPGGLARRRIWDLHSSLHCSVIGTCLATGELRALVRKFAAAVADPDDHALHTIAVAASGSRGPLARAIHKALDRRHRIAINHFGKAGCAADLQRMWQDARQAGEIPGAYWAALTHPQATDALVKQVFGDVHMLSHLVGAANRADIRRLRQLEEQNAALAAKLARQDAQLRDGIIARETKIRDLNAALSARIERDAAAAPADADRPSELATLDALVADLRRLLDGEIRRRARAEAMAAARGKDDPARAAAVAEAALLRDELEAAEARLGALLDRGGATADDLDLAGQTLLYVGGQPHQVARLRALAAQAGGVLIHHDGGIEERAELLPGLVSRAAMAFFPVDCISHRAALSLKRLCRQAGKPYVPLRSAGVASMIRALRSPELRRVTASAGSAPNP